MAKESFRKAFKGDKWKSFVNAVSSSLQTWGAACKRDSWFV